MREEGDNATRALVLGGVPAAMIQGATDRSPTFRRLVEAIQAANAIVCQMELPLADRIVRFP
jgi:hypothetical protein